MDLRQNEMINAAVQTLMVETESKDRGDILTHEEIRDITGLDPYQGSLPQILKRFRRRVEQERGITLWPERTIGFKFLTKQEQMELVPAERLNRAGRQVRRARRSVSALPPVGLTMHQRRVRSFQVDALTAAEHEIRSRRAKQAAFLRKTPSMPRPERQAVSACQTSAL